MVGCFLWQGGFCVLFPVCAELYVGTAFFAVYLFDPGRFNALSVADVVSLSWFQAICAAPQPMELLFVGRAKVVALGWRVLGGPLLGITEVA